jgi:hypothetical protein
MVANFAPVQSRPTSPPSFPGVRDNSDAPTAQGPDAASLDGDRDFLLKLEALLSEQPSLPPNIGRDLLATLRNAVTVTVPSDPPRLVPLPRPVQRPQSSSPTSSKPVPSSPSSTGSRGQLLPFRRKVVTEPVLDTTPTWHEVMVAFGQEICRLREQQQLSLDQLRIRTQIPMYHLISLESGAVDKLPEEIFVRGFLRRICNQLGPEGQALLAQLPPPPSLPQAILADWQQQSGLGAGDLRSAHLYLGYATLVAGAVGGLAWSMQHSDLLQAASLTWPESTGDVQQAGHRRQVNPVEKAHQLALGSDVAPPEQLAPEMD